MGFDTMGIARGHARPVPMALALLTAIAAAPSLADDPRDPAMTPEALARDREQIRSLNADQLAYVQQRDAQYAQGWSDYAAVNRGDGPAINFSQSAASSQRAYVQARADYERKLAQWRQDVTACRAGYYEHCAR